MATKSFYRRQKQQFEEYNSIIKGFSAEGFLAGKGENSNWALAPGIGVINRTLDDVSMNTLTSTISTYPLDDIFIPNYNVYAFSFFNTLTTGKFAWYVEGAYKTEDSINDPFGIIQSGSTTTIGDKFVGKTGSVIYSSLSYANKGLGITIEGKRTENFTLRTRPQEQLNRGTLNFLPPMTRINTYRLTSRYAPATQELGELALQADLRYNLKNKWNFNINFSKITDLEDDLLYRELYTEIVYKHERLWRLLFGLQLQQYNQEIYEFKPEVPLVQTTTPFTEFLYRFDRKKSLRIELQYMNTGDDLKAGLKQDYGDWAFAVAGYYCSSLGIHGVGYV